MSEQNGLSNEIESSNEDMVFDDLDELDFAGQKYKLKLKRFSDNTENRKWLAVWTTIIVTVWLMIVLGILILNEKHICLSNTVLVTLLGTTTVNVLGLSYIVLKGYFDSISSNEV
jgi:hypothetical protein